jgi:hypothetical protein
MNTRVLQVVVPTQNADLRLRPQRTQVGPERVEPDRALTALAQRVRGEYVEMPGLRLSVRQASRLFSVAQDAAAAVLDELQQASVLTRSDDGVYALNR